MISITKLLSIFLPLFLKDERFKKLIYKFIMQPKKSINPNSKSDKKF
jgi:hypothetical protein